MALGMQDGIGWLVTIAHVASYKHAFRHGWNMPHMRFDMQDGMGFDYMGTQVLVQLQADTSLQGALRTFPCMHARLAVLSLLLSSAICRPQNRECETGLIRQQKHETGPQLMHGVCGRQVSRKQLLNMTCMRMQ